MFGSANVDQDGGSNYTGVKSPAIDALVAAMSGAKSEEQLLPACHALERILVAGHYLIPQWYSPAHRMVYDAWRLRMPAQIPPYSPGEGWAIYTWWAQVPPKPPASAPSPQPEQTPKP